MLKSDYQDWVLTLHKSLGGIMEITPEIQALLDAQKVDLDKVHEDNLTGIKKNRDDLLAEKKLIGEEKQAALDLAQQQRLDKAAAEGDTKTLSESFAVKSTEFEAKNTELQGIIDGMKAEQKALSIDKISQSFVNEFAIDDAFIKESMAVVYKSRLDIRDGKVVVLDPTGSLTALTVEDLTKEFIGASKYAGHIKATQAKGNDAPGSKSGNRVTDTNAKAQEAAKNGDAIGHLNAHFSAHFK